MSFFIAMKAIVEVIVAEYGWDKVPKNWETMSLPELVNYAKRLERTIMKDNGRKDLNTKSDKALSGGK